MIAPSIDFKMDNDGSPWHSEYAVKVSITSCAVMHMNFSGSACLEYLLTWTATELHVDTLFTLNGLKCDTSKSSFYVCDVKKNISNANTSGAGRQ